MGDIVYQKRAGPLNGGVHGAGPPLGPIQGEPAQWVLPCYTRRMQIGPLAIYPSVRRWTVARRSGLTLRFSFSWKRR